MVVLDPNTGGIVAMASWPTFPPSWFVRGLTEGQRFLLFESKQAPMLNRATQITYGPGSTFKPFVALAALKEGLATLGGYYDCPAEYVHPGDESGTVFHNWDGHSSGALSIAQGLKVSCDTQYYKWGSDFYFLDAADEQAGTPASHASNGASDGDRGVDLPAEAAGTVPDQKYVTEHPRSLSGRLDPGYRHPARDRCGRDEGDTAAGRAGVRGDRERQALPTAPGLDDRGQQRETWRRRSEASAGRIPYTETELDYIREALRSVTTGGTASSVFAPCSLDVAGKTGTAERPPFQDTSWFAGHRSRGSTPVRGGGHR